jgi:hypothetical protein
MDNRREIVGASLTVTELRAPKLAEYKFAEYNGAQIPRVGPVTCPTQFADRYRNTSRQSYGVAVSLPPRVTRNGGVGNVPRSIPPVDSAPSGYRDACLYRFR